MQSAVRAYVVSVGLSEVAEEFKRLDERRRAEGLSLGDAERYRTLFARLSDVLVSGERRRRADLRQFLRVPFPMTVTLRQASGATRVACHNFGGGGCLVSSDLVLQIGDDVWLAGAEIGSERHPLTGRATIAWTRMPSSGEAAYDYGVRFCLDAPNERDEVDRLFYRVLDRFLVTPE